LPLPENRSGKPLRLAWFFFGADPWSLVLKQEVQQFSQQDIMVPVAGSSGFKMPPEFDISRIL
jgi:hypothetical protein